MLFLTRGSEQKPFSNPQKFVDFGDLELIVTSSGEFWDSFEKALWFQEQRPKYDNLRSSFER